MNKANDILAALNHGRYDAAFARLYGEDNVATQRERYSRAVCEYVNLFGDADDLALFSAPGRTEIGGNHTDHNHGCVLAAGVNLDVIAVAARTADPVLHVQSAGYQPDVIELGNLAVQAQEKNRSASLIRGVAARFEQLGYAVGGLRAYTTSDVLKGSGLSSSAAFEVLIGTMLSHLYNGGAVGAVEIAQIAQYAENVYFGKPCGLMDQMASSVGGMVFIDFVKSESPVVEKLDFDFSKSGYALCIIDSGADHADLTDEYAAIPGELKQLCACFGKEYLRQIPENDFMKALPELRGKVTDRAILRAMHVYGENKRVVAQVAALKAGDIDTFLRLCTESGHSSWMYLQNICPAGAVEQQAVALMLALCDKLLQGRGAYRVHGGGFAGTVQVFVPNDMLDEFKTKIEAVLGAGSCHVMNIRENGGIRVEQPKNQCKC